VVQEEVRALARTQIRVFRPSRCQSSAPSTGTTGQRPARGWKSRRRRAGLRQAAQEFPGFAEAHASLGQHSTRGAFDEAEASTGGRPRLPDCPAWRITCNSCRNSRTRPRQVAALAVGQVGFQAEVALALAVSVEELIHHRTFPDVTHARGQGQAMKRPTSKRLSARPRLSSCCRRSRRAPPRLVVGDQDGLLVHRAALDPYCMT